MKCGAEQGKVGILAIILLLAANVAWAHGDEAHAPIRPSLWTLWSFEPGVVIPLALSAVMYSLGVRRLPTRFRTEAVLFFGGWILLAVALISPVHRWGSWLFSVHMTQHEVLMVGAAPLLALSRPGLVMARALPSRFARMVAGWADRCGVSLLWDFLTRPAVAWLLHAFTLWAWHIPSWFEATLTHEWVHALQHASFFISALWFWHSVFRGPRRVADYGWGVLNLFFTAVHSSVLGALITFSPRAWYPSYAETAPVWGLSALEDQQLGGLVMWVPAGLVYILAALVLLAAWLRAAPERAAATGATS